MSFHDKQTEQAINIADQKKRRPLIDERSFTKELLPTRCLFNLRSKKLVNAKKLKDGKESLLLGETAF